MLGLKRGSERGSGLEIGLWQTAEFQVKYLLLRVSYLRVNKNK